LHGLEIITLSNMPIMTFRMHLGILGKKPDENEYIDIQNYRKLKTCRIRLTEEETLLVGANNSGKTSAMDALISFWINEEDRLRALHRVNLRLYEN
jgi:recombinational DNA repair ATPase RecF